MSKQTIGIGSAANDGTGDPLRTAFDKVNQNFSELYGMQLASSGAAVSHTGDTAETALATINIPANTIGPNGRIIVYTNWSATNNANNKTLKHRFSGAGGTNIGQLIVTTQGGGAPVVQICNRNASNAQNCFNGLAGPIPATATAVDMTQAQTIVLTGTLANAADTVTLEGYLAVVYP